VPRTTTLLPHGRPHAPTAFFIACSSFCTVVMVVNKQTMDTNDSPANLVAQLKKELHAGARNTPEALSEVTLHK
jgi:hypothetical protein